MLARAAGAVTTTVAVTVWPEVAPTAVSTYVPGEFNVIVTENAPEAFATVERVSGASGSTPGTAMVTDPPPGAAAPCAVAVWVTVILMVSPGVKPVPENWTDPPAVMVPLETVPCVAGAG